MFQPWTEWNYADKVYYKQEELLTASALLTSSYEWDFSLNLELYNSSQ